MAPALVNFTLPATVIFTVVIPGLQDFNITNPSSNVTEFPRQSRIATLPDGYFAYPDIGLAYKVSDVKLNWTSARRQCISEGAHLADIDTIRKLDLILTQITYGLTWTGFHKMRDDTKWFSSKTGLTMTTLPWANEQPYGDYYCAYVSIIRHGLAIADCNSEYPFICELPIPQNYNA